MSETPNSQPQPGEFVPAPQAEPSYGQPAYAGYEPKKSAALAIASLVLGVISILSGVIIVGGFFGFVGIILGIIALIQIRKGKATGKGMAIGGIVTGVVGIVISIVVIVMGILATMMLQECAKSGHEQADGSYVCTIGGETHTLSPNDYNAIRNRQ